MLLKAKLSLVLALLFSATGASASWIDDLGRMSPQQVRETLESNCDLTLKDENGQNFSDRPYQYHFVEKSENGLALIPGRVSKEEIEVINGDGVTKKTVVAKEKHLLIPPHRDSFRLDRIELRVTVLGYPRVKGLELSGENLDGGFGARAKKDQIHISKANRDFTLKVSVHHPVDFDRPAVDSLAVLSCRN